MIIQKTSNSRISSFDPNNFTFRTTFGDHMLICEYENGAWCEPKIMPYGPLPITPANMTFNYGQACFEGMKAYKDENDDVFLFRPEKNLLGLINLPQDWQCQKFLNMFSWMVLKL